MNIELLENKYRVLIAMFGTSYLNEENLRVTYVKKPIVGDVTGLSYGKLRMIYKKLIDDELIEKVKTQSGVGYIITDKGMKIINKIKGDDNL